MLSKKKAPAGAPEWVLTYGDMMSLLLCFFILLAAFADYEKGGGAAEMKAAIRSLQEALGMKVPPGSLADDKIDYNSIIEKLKLAIKMNNDRFRGDTREQGISGDNFRLRRIRDGTEITIGGPILFEPFSDQLTEDGRQSLEEIASSLTGHRNKIEVCGHAGEEPRPSDWTVQDVWKLSYTRAENVALELIRNGVNERSIRIMAVGAGEPVTRRAYSPTQRVDNRRVEIIVRESLIDDYVGEKPVQGIEAVPPTKG
ncbi:MAG: OmpA family protein [Phycisphaerae bacterium]|nr:OmpA family protein [Phycisphaerae bacterium]